MSDTKDWTKRALTAEAALRDLYHAAVGLRVVNGITTAALISAGREAKIVLGRTEIGADEGLGDLAATDHLADEEAEVHVVRRRGKADRDAG
jgi:hypothetical protein